MVACDEKDRTENSEFLLELESGEAEIFQESALFKYDISETKSP